MKLLRWREYVVGIRWNLTFHEMSSGIPWHAGNVWNIPRNRYASYNKCLEILGISWNARQRPGKYCNLAKIIRMQSLPRHYMECQNYGPALFVTALKVAQVRALCPLLVFHSNHGLLCACCVRAWVADAKRTLGLREAFREQFMLGGQWMRQCGCSV